MTGTRRPTDDAALRVAAHDHTDHLRRRVRAAAAELARTEDALARVYDRSATLRPHAAERLRDGARRARDAAERRRRYADRTPGRIGQADGDASCDQSGGTPCGRQTAAS